MLFFFRIFSFTPPPPPPPLRLPPSNKNPWQESRQVSCTVIHFPTASVSSEHGSSFATSRGRSGGGSAPGAAGGDPRAARPPPPPGGGSAERPAPAQPRRGCGRKSPGRRLRSGTGKGGKVAFSDFGLNPHPPGWTRGDSPRRASLLRVWVRTRGSGHLSPCSPCRCCCGVPPSAHGQAHKQTGRLAANASGSRPLSSLSGPLPSARVSGKNRGEGRVKLSALGGGGWLGSKVGSRASATAPHRRLLLE